MADPKSSARVRVAVVAGSSARAGALARRVHGPDIDVAHAGLADTRPGPDEIDVIVAADQESLRAVSRLDAGEPRAPLVFIGHPADTRDNPLAERLAGELPEHATAAQIRAAILAVAAGLTVSVAAEPKAAVEIGTDEGEDGGQFEALTPREREVLDALSLGLSNRAIASRLGLSEHTVKFHMASIFGKLGAKTRTQAVRYALRRGLLAI